MAHLLGRHSNVTVTVRWLGRICAFGLALGLAVNSHAGPVDIVVTKADGSPLHSAVVSLSVAGQSPLRAKAGTKALMIQENKQFAPFVLPVQMGTTVEFPNNDPFRHQVYSFSPAKSFELKLYAAPEVGTQLFDKEGTVSLGCNIHDNMRAYVYVVGTPYFAATDEKGVAHIPQVPPGNYVMKTWHPNVKGATAAEQPIAVPAQGPLEITARLELKRDRRQRKPGAVDERDY